MPSRLFVVAGCARSGLGFTSRILTALGAPCGHEDVFNPPAYECGATLMWPHNLAGDASWLVGPVLGKLPERTVVLHQVRHPLATIHGLHSSGFFERATSHRSFVQDILPETRRGDSLVRCMRFWLEWNRMIEGAADYEDLVYQRFAVEEFLDARICEIVALLGLARDVSTSRRVLQAIPGVGRAADQHGMTWDKLPGGDLRDELIETAEGYGYGESLKRDVGA